MDLGPHLLGRFHDELRRHLQSSVHSGGHTDANIPSVVHVGVDSQHASSGHRVSDLERLPCAVRNPRSECRCPLVAVIADERAALDELEFVAQLLFGDGHAHRRIGPRPPFRVRRVAVRRRRPLGHVETPGALGLDLLNSLFAPADEKLGFLSACRRGEERERRRPSRLRGQQATLDRFAFDLPDLIAHDQIV